MAEKAAPKQESKRPQQGQSKKFEQKKSAPRQEIEIIQQGQKKKFKHNNNPSATH